MTHTYMYINILKKWIRKFCVKLKRLIFDTVSTEQAPKIEYLQCNVRLRKL